MSNTHTCIWLCSPAKLSEYDSLKWNVHIHTHSHFYWQAQKKIVLRLAWNICWGEQQWKSILNVQIVRLWFLFVIRVPCNVFISCFPFFRRCLSCVCTISYFVEVIFFVQTYSLFGYSVVYYSFVIVSLIWSSCCCFHCQPYDWYFSSFVGCICVCFLF